VHSLITKVAQIANNPTNKRHFKTGVALKSSIYCDVARDFERIKSNTLNTISSSSLGALFTSPPLSYSGPKEAL
jgi:hypothetical protein